MYTSPGSALIVIRVTALKALPCSSDGVRDGDCCQQRHHGAGSWGSPAGQQQPTADGGGGGGGGDEVHVTEARPE